MVSAVHSENVDILGGVTVHDYSCNIVSDIKIVNDQCPTLNEQIDGILHVNVDEF